MLLEKIRKGISRHSEGGVVAVVMSGIDDGKMFTGDVRFIRAAPEAVLDLLHRETRVQGRLVGWRLENPSMALGIKYRVADENQFLEWVELIPGRSDGPPCRDSTVAGAVHP